MQIVGCRPNDIPCKLVFSALDSGVALECEKAFAQAGYVVVSNAKSHRMDSDVPLIIPEVNMDHLELAKTQKTSPGMIITNPNCSVIGLVLALRPLHLEFGIERAHVVTLQSTSGAGFPGVPSLSILDNVIPYIADEEDKIETEPQKIFGAYKGSTIDFDPITVSAQCTRVPVTEGHMAIVSVKLRDKATLREVKRAWQEFWPPVQELKLPSSCTQIIHYLEENDMPQPKLHRYLEKGMGIAVGRLQECPVLDYKFVVLSNNMIRGAAGGSIFIGELLVGQGYIFW
jgi:aspartate-semialdehyde dehydrogenase